MPTQRIHLRRTEPGLITATNESGVELTLGHSERPDVFCPAELLLVALGGCALLTSEALVSRRAGERADQQVRVSAELVESRLDDMRAVLDADLAELDPAERAALVARVERAWHRLCPVSRTLEGGTEVSMRVAEPVEKLGAREV